MASKTQDTRRVQHPVTFSPNPAAKTLAQALANSKKQVEAAKRK